MSTTKRKKNRATLALFFYLLSLKAQDHLDTTDLKNMQKEIADDLISIRKEFSSTQAKVYSALDKISQIISSHLTLAQEKEFLKEQEKKMHQEIEKLKQQIKREEEEDQLPRSSSISAEGR